MAINQFAKISPIVNDEGVLLEVNDKGIIQFDNSGNVKLSNRSLKNNEIGIVYEKNIVITMYDGKIIKLSNQTAISSEEFDSIVTSNIDGDFDGSLFCVKTTKDDEYPKYELRIVNGTSYFVANDNIMRADFWRLQNGELHGNTYIGTVPYTIARITIKADADIRQSSKIFIGKLNIFNKPDADTKEIIHSIDFDGTIDVNGFNIFECIFVYSDRLGKIGYELIHDDTDVTANYPDTGVDICLEYVVH